MIGIIGKGFGVYGYLPALIELNQQVLVLIEYRNIISDRKELKGYLNKINFCESEDLLFEKSSQIVIATTPKKQFFLVKKILDNYGHIRTFYLEKPLTPNPLQSIKLISKLKENNINVCVDYNFLITPWFSKLARLINGKSESFEIDWGFSAKFLSSNSVSWKSKEEEGGGIINFYGIHIIAVATALGLNITSSTIIIYQDKPSKWKAVFENQESKLNVCISIISPNDYFIVRDTTSSKIITSLVNPFSNKNIDPKKLDPRVPILKKIITSNFNSFFRDIDNLQEVNKLWEKVINMSKNIKYA